MSRLSSARIYLLLLSVLISTSGLYADGLTRVTLTFDSPVYINMPVWVHINFPTDSDARSANVRYPFHPQPWELGLNELEVKYDGVLLPKIKQTIFYGITSSGPPHGSCAPQSSPKNRLPLHLFYKLDKPGTYMVHYKCYEIWPTKEYNKVMAESDWTPVIVNPFSAEQRDEWVKDQLAHQPSDPGLIIGDYLPSLLAQPDEKVLPAFLKCLRHSDQLVQEYALYSLDYFGNDVIKREIPRLIAKDGPTTEIGYYLTWRRDLFQPMRDQLTDSLIPFLKSDVPDTVGGTINALVFLSYDYDKNAPEISKKTEDAIWDAVPHILTFKEREALWPLTVFMGSYKSDRGHNLLWKLSDNPSVRQQALISISGYKDHNDLPKLGGALLNGDMDVAMLPNYLREIYGAAATPYLLDGVKKSSSDYVIRNCAMELVRGNSRDAYLLFKDIFKYNRPKKEAVMRGLRNGFDKPQATEADLLKLIDGKLAAMK